MNIAELMILLELQKAGSAWQIGDSGNNSDSNNTDQLLFANLLQSALKDVTLESPNGELSSVQRPQPSKGSSLPGQNLQGKTDYDQLIMAMGQKYGVDSNLIKQVVNAESGYDSQAVSGAGAAGLMQLMPGTAESYGVQNSLDPVQNLDGGTHFLRDLLDRFQGNIPLALAAYNAGPGAVEKYQGIPPYKETQAYVQTIMTGLNNLDRKV